MGYRGYFELDWLIDLDDGELYLGELNPRLTGASPLTNLAAFAHADAPLFLFHLLEYSNLPFTLNVDALNRRWATAEHADPWGQLILKHVGDTPLLISDAPKSGAWVMREDGRIRWPGDDIGVLVVRGRLMDADGALTDRAKMWNRGIRDEFRAAVT